eukprot:TRINITY_DN8410_c0_g1_i2.p1 TRINITY_DN8410_c0_g1~~TRINITY_DN8410_c0_g1_i2.p1  ORF type:complete len:306 (-),score=29.83 TRINITY_DN8410_c0_g1_i2:74-991(-)
MQQRACALQCSTSRRLWLCILSVYSGLVGAALQHRSRQTQSVVPRQPPTRSLIVTRGPRDSDKSQLLELKKKRVSVDAVNVTVDKRLRALVTDQVGPSLTTPRPMESFSAVGCRTTPDLQSISVRDSSAMSVETCFAFCAGKPNHSPTRYFGITRGTKCWCGDSLHEGHADASSCDSACYGNKAERCGGTTGESNVFVMFRCNEKTQEQKKNEAQHDLAVVRTSYDAVLGQTCGANGATIKIDGSATNVQSLDACMMACSRGRNSAHCHGFAFDVAKSHCTYYGDALKGPMEANPVIGCFHKRLN